MSWITARPIATDMIKDRNVFAFALWNRFDKPSIQEPMDSIVHFVDSNLTIPIMTAAHPVPTTCLLVNLNFSEDSANGFSRDIINDEHLMSVHNKHISRSAPHVNDYFGWTPEALQKLKEMENG